MKKNDRILALQKAAEAMARGDLRRIFQLATMKSDTWAGLWERFPIILRDSRREHSRFIK